MKKADADKLLELLKEPKNIAIIPHKNPDGDAMGSTLALRRFLNKKGHTATVVSPNDYPEFLKWLPDEETVVKYDLHTANAKQTLEHADVIFTLDFNSFSRCGDLQPLLEKSNATFVMIDHHQQPDDYAEITYSDVNVCATSEMVYHVIDALNELDLIDKDIATCLYTGIMTDTGSFKFNSTTSLTHRVIASLIDNGANNSEIHDKIYDTFSHNRLKLLGVALNNLNYLPEYKTAFITLSQKELDEHGFQKGDTEGFVNYGLSLLGVKMAAIFIENKQENIVKISLRSKGEFSVNELSRQHFHGGGHTNAAGGRSDVSLRETVDYFISILPQYKNALNE